MSEHDEQGVPLQRESLGDFHLVWNLDTAKLHWRLISKQLSGSGDEMRFQLLALDTPEGDSNGDNNVDDNDHTYHVHMHTMLQ